MSVPTIQHSQIYDGNGSAVTAYAIPFPFLAVAEMKVAVKPPGGEFAVLSDGYTVSRLPDGSGGSVTTATAYANTYRVQVFRATSLLQQVDLPDSGALPSAAVEGGLDRLTMALQELNARVNTLLGIPNEGVVSVPGGSVALAQDVATWTDAAARSAVIPKRAGQLGVQLSDDTIWIAQSMVAGSWQEFAVAAAPAVYPARATLAFAADTGVTGDNQNTLAGAFSDWRDEAGGNFHAVLGGDIRYGGTGTLATETAAFDFLWNVGRLSVFPGNHCVDGGYAEYMAKYGSQSPDGKSYWTKILFGGLVQVWGMDWGRNTARTFVGPSYAEQRAWLAASIAASTARWKIGGIHCPPVATLPGSNMDNADTAVDWPEFEGLHALLVGHGHNSDYLLLRSLPVINASSVVQTRQPTKWAPQGPLAGQSVCCFADSTRRLAVRCFITPHDFTVQFVDMYNRSIRYQRSLNDKTLPCDEWHDTLLDDPESLAVGVHRGALPMMRAMQVTEVRIGVTESSTEDTVIEVWKDGAAFTTLKLPNGNYTATIACNETVGQAARISCRVASGAAGYGVQAKGLRVGFLGRWVS